MPSFHEVVSEYIERNFGKQVSSSVLQGIFLVSAKGDLTFSGISKAKSKDVASFQSLMLQMDIPLQRDVAQRFLELLHKAAADSVDTGEQRGIDRAALVEGLREFIVAVRFNSRMKIGCWTQDGSKELRIVDAPRDIPASLSPARRSRFTEWFVQQFRAGNIPKADTFTKQGFSFDSPPPVHAWLDMDKQETLIVGLLHESGDFIESEKIPGVSWNPEETCFYNPISRGHIPVRMENGKPRLALKPDGSAYDLGSVPDAWEAFESRLHPELREFWRAQIFSIFAPVGLRGRMAIWGRSSGEKGQSVVQNVIRKHMGDTHCVSAGQKTWIYGWKHGSADLWNKSLVFTSDVKGEGCGLMRNEIFHQFTGSDAMTVEPKFGNLFSARAWGKVWITSNEFPNIEVGAVHAITRLALFEFGDLPPEIRDREIVKDENGNPILDVTGLPLWRADFEERLEATTMDYLALCFRAWWTHTFGMMSPVSRHPKHMHYRIVAACGSQAHIAVLRKFDEFFETGTECRTAAGDVGHILRAWSKNDPGMKFETLGFVKWCEALSAGRGGCAIRLEYEESSPVVVGIAFRGEVRDCRGKVSVVFPDGNETEFTL